MHDKGLYFSPVRRLIQDIVTDNKHNNWGKKTVAYLNTAVVSTEYV